MIINALTDSECLLSCGMGHPVSFHYTDLPEMTRHVDILPPSVRNETAHLPADGVSTMMLHEPEVRVHATGEMLRLHRRRPAARFDMPVELPDASRHVRHRRVPYIRPLPLHHAARELAPLRVVLDVHLFGMQPHSRITFEILPHVGYGIEDVTLVVRKDIEVVHVASVPAEPALHPHVEPVEVEVGEYLAGQVPDGQAVVVAHREQGLVRRYVVPHRRRGLAEAVLFGAVHHHLPYERGEQPELPFGKPLPHEPFKHPPQRRLVYGHEEPLHVELAYPAVPRVVPAALPYHVLQPHDPVQCAFSLAAVVVVLDERVLKEMPDAADDDMVHHTVAEVGGEYLPQLRTRHDERDAAPYPVCAVIEVTAQVGTVRFVVRLERQLVHRPPLVPAALVVSVEDFFQCKSVFHIIPFLLILRFKV